MIEAVGLTKRYGAKTAVYNLSFQVRPGTVTGFLGPNGSGKSTTMRMILGLDRPSAGRVTIDGRPFRAWDNAPRQVGALLDAKAVHGGRSARHHLLSLAQLGGLPARRVDEVLGMVGLQDVARRRSRGFSLGMGQRLGIAAALLGDPRTLLFDEPVNGLDPEGILWVRNLMKGLAAEGRTVFVSSHLMSEMALTADHLIVIGRGQLLADMKVSEFIAANSAGFARVRTADGEPERREAFVAALNAAGAQVTPEPDGALRVVGLTLPRVSDLAHETDTRLWELSPHQASLEEAYMRLTQGAVDYRSTSDPRHALYAAAGAALPGQAPVPRQMAQPVPTGADPAAPAPFPPGQAPGAPATPGAPGAPDAPAYAGPAPHPHSGPRAPGLGPHLGSLQPPAQAPAPPSLAFPVQQVTHATGRQLPPPAPPAPRPAPPAAPTEPHEDAR